MLRLSRGRHFKHLLQKAIALIVGAMLLYKCAIAFIERDPSIEVIIDKSNDIDINRIFNATSRDHVLLVPDRANYLNNNKKEYKIPRILHQFWDTSKIPTDFEEWIHSWIFRHPDWEYYFWTDDEVRKLISKHYPEHEALYKSYPGMLYRANAMRYFVLHRYGGVYADLDVEALRPIDFWLQGPHNCFLSLENFEHAYFHYEAEDPVVMNTIMACRPDHPFYSTLIDELPAFKHKKDTLHANGPFFLNSMYKKYSKDSPKDPVLAVHPKFFLPTFDPVILEKIKKGCVFSHRSSPKVCGSKGRHRNSLALTSKYFHKIHRTI